MSDSNYTIDTECPHCGEMIEVRALNSEFVHQQNANLRIVNIKLKKHLRIVRNYLQACVDKKLSGNEYQAAELLELIGINQIPLGESK